MPTPKLGLRVTPGGFVFSAEASVRTFGTLPPAGGLTEVSGLGSGQKAVRSTLEPRRQELAAMLEGLSEEPLTES